MTLNGSTIALVGDTQEYNVSQLLAEIIGTISGNRIEKIEFTELISVKDKEINYPINRDQVVLAIAGDSIDRKSPDYDKLLLFDQIFGGGVLGGLHSRLFQLREETGMFYTINGSLLVQSSEQPGLALIKTIVSLDRVDEAEKAIRGLIDTVADTLTPEELKEAQLALINSMVKNFETNAKTAQTFLFLDRYDLPENYFDTRAQQLSKIGLDDIKPAVKKVLRNDKLLTLRVGRV